MTDEAAYVTPARLREIKQSIWFRIGTLRETMNEFDSALTAFEKVLVHNPSHAAARAKAGTLLMKKECYRDAISYLHSAVSLDSENPPAWVALAYSYVMSEELDNAYQAYHTAMSKMTHYNDPTLWFGVGIMYDRMGLLDHALEAFHAVLHLSPRFEATDKICYDLGLIYKEQHKYELAHKYMTRVLSNTAQQNMAYAEAMYQIGHIHELAGNTSSAMEAYHGALSRNPNHIKCLQYLGWLTFKSGKAEEADHMLSRATQIDPTDAYTFYMIGRMSMANNDYHKAYDNYQHAVYRDGKNANFWCAIGILYFHMSQHRDAMDAYTRAIRINPHMTEVWYDMGTLYEIYKQTNDAMDAYRRVLQLQPNDSQASQRLATLQHAMSSGVTPPAPYVQPRTEGPVVSPNPDSATRPHSRSDAPDRIGSLPAPPSIPARPSITSPAPAPYRLPDAHRRDESQMANASLSAVPTAGGPSNSKVEKPNMTPNGSIANGIVADSSTYPVSSGYSGINDRPVPNLPPASAAEASSQLSSLNKPHPGGNFNHGGVSATPDSSRPLDAILTQDRISPRTPSSGQMIRGSEPLSNIQGHVTQVNGSPARSVPLHTATRSSVPMGGTNERHELYHNDHRQNGYEDPRLVHSDSNRSNFVRREVYMDRPNSTALQNGQRSAYHNAQTEANRSQPLPTQGDLSQSHRILHPQQHQSNPGAPLASNIPSEERSRLSASSSFERKAGPVEAARPAEPKDRPRTSGDNSVRSTEQDNRLGSPGSRNSRRSLPAPLQEPPVALSGRLPGPNMTSMGRRNDQLDEAMLPRLRPLPDQKASIPATEASRRGPEAPERERPPTTPSHMDRVTQSDAHRSWTDPSGVNHRRESLDGISPRANRSSPRSQHSPYDNSGSREHTGLPRTGAVPGPREHGYRNAQISPSRQQSSENQLRSDNRATNMHPNHEPVSKLHDERVGNHLKQYSSQASMSTRDTKTDHPSHGDGTKIHEQTQRPAPINKLETYGSNGSYVLTDNPAPRGDSDRGQFPHSTQDSDRANVISHNGFHNGAAPSISGHRADPSSRGGDVRPTSKTNGPESHFGSGTPPSFSKSLPRATASNGLMSVPIPGKEPENVTGQNRAYYERTQGSYGSGGNGPADAQNGFSSSPRGSKRKMADLIGVGTEASDGKQLGREQRNSSIPEGMATTSGLTRPDGAAFPQINARALPEPAGPPRGDGEDIVHSHKRMRPHRMGEEALGPRLNGGQLKSRE